MALTQAQKNTLKADVIAASDQACQDLEADPSNNDKAFAVASLYNLTASPDYWVWKDTISRSDIYDTTSPDATTWDWGTYKTQGATEQNAWTQMFMGDVGRVGNVNFRAGITAIFTGSAPQVAQRNHCFAVSRKKATRVEKLFGVAVVNPPANTGNNTGNARGSSTNPDNLGFSGTLSYTDVLDAMQNGV